MPVIQRTGRLYRFFEHCLAHEIDAGGGSCSKVVKTLDALVSGSWFIYIPLCRHPAQPSWYTTRSCQKGRISNPLLGIGVDDHGRGGHGRQSSPHRCCRPAQGSCFRGLLVSGKGRRQDAASPCRPWFGQGRHRNERRPHFHKRTSCPSSR